MGPCFVCNIQTLNVIQHQLLTYQGTDKGSEEDGHNLANMYVNNTGFEIFRFVRPQGYMQCVLQDRLNSHCRVYKKVNRTCNMQY